MAEVQRRPENVGRILVQVQEDLHNLKEQMSAMKLEGSNQIDLKSIDDALMRTEQGLKQNAEYVVSMMNNQVMTLPTVDEGSRRSSRPRASMQKMRESSGRPQLHPSLFHDSPGENFQHNLTMKALLNPENLNNREVLHRNYNFTLPAIKPPRQAKLINQSVTRGCTVDQLSVLPRANRTDPSLPPPSIMEKDAKKGILSLIERGLIPPAAELTLDPSPVHHKRARLHNAEEATRKQLQSESSARGEGSHYMASVKLDLSHDGRLKINGSGNSQRLGTSEGAMTASVPPSSANYSRSAGSPQLRSVLIQSPTSRKKSGYSSTTGRSPLPLRVFDAPLQPLPPPATPAQKEEDQHQVVAAGQGYSFFITSGNLPRSGDPEFSAFHQRYLLQWGSVITMVAKLQKVLQDYAIPTAYVNGDRLAELSRHYELEYQPTRDELLTVLENYEDVLAMISTPGRRFLGTDGRYIAVSKIQATWRRYRDRRAYLQYRKQRWAAGVIAISWIMHVRMSRMRKRLRHIRRSHLDNYRARGKTLALEWNRITSSRRVIVHVPSLGHPTQIRFGMSGFDRKQNAQMARLCDLIDTNVEVIYVSPVEVLEELQQYYCKLLGLKGAVEEADPEKVGDLSTRFTIVTPEALNKFPTHHMCLASLLKYSPCALSRIKKLIAGRDAYYVPGVIHKDDISVADELNIPILGCEPEICHLYSSKSGGRRVFAAADATAPPGDHDVYSAQQLHESMARLICENPYVTKWLMKIDSGFDGRSIAYIEVNKHLPCYLWMLRESRRYGDKWSKKWAQDAAYTKVLCELPDALDNFACPANKDVFPTWVDFLDAFLGQGGIIEAYPPTESVTCLTIDMLIDPTGKMHMTSCGDQIHAENTFRCWGTSVPQASVEPAVLNDVSMRIAEACRARGVIGYFSIDYVTFIDPVTYKQTLWATDLTLAYSDQMAMTQMLLFVTGGKLDAAEGRLVVPPPPKPKQARFRKRDDDKDKLPPPNLTRFSVMSTNLVHTNMAVVHYSVFFQMCRAHGIGFDIKERQGTVFTLVDSSKREELGMLSVGEDLPSALASFARNLTVIHQEISAPNMQGRTNFKAAVDDIEIILGTTAQNEKEDEKENKNLSA
uniref:IQ domain-containing protein H-like isoform X2 n=1 Tax=Ciona intestinalis TaxID=7719 RepID=UPI0002B8DE5B|nr:IQ domain-containing protein H-like isoform X2 [Ciona intestinalis]|eukprot:XP_026689991.1 IQ domain-containing protein H-like isoform X2 [Ciona intestinalis]